MMSGKIKLRQILFALLFSLLICFSSFGKVIATIPLQPPQTAPKESDCWPLDIVLLTDQSLSIFANDPDNYRAIAANRILTLLVSNRRSQCPEAIHRFGMVTFGDYTNTVLNLVPIDIQQDADRETWFEDRNYLEKIEEATKDRTQNATDFDVAFKQAEDLFNEAPDIDDPVGYEQRRQVVILLTDGNPDGVGNVTEYMCDLSNYLDSAAWDTTSIWVLALNASGGPYLENPGCEGTIRDDWQRITKQHSGQLLDDVEYNEHMIPAYMKDVIDAEFGQPGQPLECGTFHVEPYLEQIKMTFQKNLEDEQRLVVLEKLIAEDEVLYRYKDGRALEPAASSKMVFRDDLYYNRDLAEVYVFDHPLPGDWRFEVGNLTDEQCEARVEARENPKKTAVELLQPEDIIDLVAEPPYYDENTPLLRIHILDAETRTPFEVNPDYPLTVTARLVPPSPIDTTTIFNLYEQEPGVWTSGQPMLAPQKGIHKVEIVGESVAGDGSPGYGVFTETVTYEVLEREPLSFEIKFPVEGHNLDCNTIENQQRIGLSLPVEVWLLNSNREPIAGKDYLASDPNQTFFATLSDNNHNEIDTLVLNTDLNQVGVFEGTLLKDRSIVEGCGDVNLTVEFRGALDVRKFTMPITKETVAFTRGIVEGVLVDIADESPSDRVLLHPTLWAARPGGYVNDVQLEFRLKNLNDNWLEPSETATDPKDLYIVELFGPTPALHEVLTPTKKPGPDGTWIAATGGLTMTKPGEYYFRISPQPGETTDSYMLADEEPLIVTFERYDTLWTSPKTALILTIIGVLVLLIIIGLIIYGLTGGPGGTIKLLDHETKKEIKTWRLSRARFFTNVIGIRDGKLKEYKIKVIKAKKTQPLEEKRAALITMIATDGEILLSNEPLESNYTQEVILSGDLDSVDIQYF